MADYNKQASMIARLVQDTGKVLVVGAAMKRLPEAIRTHPKIIVWDITNDNMVSREVNPSTKVIIWTRDVTGRMVQKLDEAVRHYRAIKIPAVRHSDLAELLEDLVPSEVPRSALVDPTPSSVEVAQHQAAAPAAQRKPTMTMQAFVEQHLNLHLDYTGKSGNMTKEAKRILTLWQAAGGQSTEGSIVKSVQRAVKAFQEAVGPVASTPAETTVVRREPVLTITEPPVAAPPQATGNELIELQAMIEDAIAALNLVKEQLPKIEAAAVKKAKAEVIKLLGGA